MNDERITEYIRAQAHSAPPAGFTASVMRAVEETPQQRALITRWIPVAALTGLAAAVTLMAVMLRPPSGGPEPTQSPPASVGSASSTPSPSASIPALVDAGSSVTIDALDSGGSWGTVYLERRDDLAGYPGVDDLQDAFVIEIRVSYHPQRDPDPDRFGASDWAVRPLETDGRDSFVAQPGQFARIDGSGAWPEDPLGMYQGATDSLATRPEGTVAFAIPRDAADRTLELIYQPAGGPAEVTIVVREPGAPPEPPDPMPTASPSTGRYVAVEGLPITVLESSAAQDLFEQLDSCTDPEAGWVVTYPDPWYTNTRVGETAACSWFGPTTFDVVVPGEVPEEIWITLRWVDGVVGYTSLTKVYYNEEVTIGGMSGRRVEYNPDPTGKPDHREYHYVVAIEEFGPTFVATTSGEMADDYELAKAVLDRIMARIEFTDPP